MNNCITYLLNNNLKDIANFRHSINHLLRNYYLQFPCDIICFYEKDFPCSELNFLKENFNSIQNICKHNIIFEQIQFSIPNYSEDVMSQIPEYFPHPDYPNASGFSLGYRHMCRFFAGDIFTNKTIQKYKYVWRLDTDSFILSPITYDVFDRMKSNNYIYGYINIQHDHPKTVENLWELSKNYFSERDKQYDIFSSEKLFYHKNRVFYTNFEIMDIEWFSKDPYRSFFDYIDSTAGIYKYRWGDHCIRYIGVKSLVPITQQYFFNDIRYYHQQEYLNREVIDTFQHAI